MRSIHALLAASAAGLCIQLAAAASTPASTPANTSASVAAAPRPPAAAPVAGPANARAAAGAARFEDPAAAVARVLRLANERLSLMGAVAAWKWQHHAPVTAPAREQAVIDHAARVARSLGLPPPDVARLFALQVRLAREQEQRLETRWRARGYDYRGEPPSLQTVLRPRLDRITGEQLAALYLAAPQLARVDFVSGNAARATAELRAAGWSDATRRQLLADLHAIGAAAAALPAAAAPHADALERIRYAGVLRVGLTGDYAPFSLESADGTLVGADVDRARSLAGALGVRALFVHTTWADLLPDLAAGRFDVAMGGVSVTPARAAAAAFSIPYDSSGKTVLVRCADARRFGSLAALDQPGVTVIVNAGGTNQEYVLAHLHRARVRVLSDNRAVFGEILAHRADAMITDEVEVALQTRAHRGLCRGMPGILPRTRADKAVLLPKDPALVRAVNAWLRAGLTSGQRARSSGGGPRR
ncbi:MAG TPA: transporter substrate-binding domain-containing protein [Steroidobacteraceae bacterium]|nr:transporter substrate-binding domain-containing protein [Steroidobacteraceae bacterium]